MNLSFVLGTVMFLCLLTMGCSQLWEHKLGVGKFGMAEMASDGNDGNTQRYSGIFVPYEKYKTKRYMRTPIQTKRPNKEFMNFAFRNPTLIAKYLPHLSHLIIQDNSMKDMNQLKLKHALQLENPKTLQVMKYLTRVV